MESSKELYSILEERLTCGVVFVSILMVTGCVGNLLVILVYIFRMKESNHRIFIVFLGLLDFLASSVAMPFTVIILRNQEMIRRTPTCKLYWFVNYILCSASVFTLLVIAIERYRKICVPLGWQLTRRVAIISCVIILFIAIATSWPVLILIGTTKEPKSTPRISDSICETEDKDNYEMYLTYYHVALSLLAGPCFVALVVLYGLVWRVVRKITSKKEGKCKDIKAKESSESDRKTSSRGNSDKIDQAIALQDITSSKDKQNRMPPHSSETNDQKKFNMVKKTTTVFFLITVIFFISYIPYMILMVLIYAKSFSVLTSSGVVIINTLLYIPYINNIANVFIYAGLDVQFRREVKKIYNDLIWRKMRQH